MKNNENLKCVLRQKVAAPWVLSMLASLYWRVVGKPRNALDCLQLALDSVPYKFKDVPLISIASISHKFSLIDNALSVTEEAYKINPVEVSYKIIIIHKFQKSLLSIVVFITFVVADDEFLVWNSVAYEG